MIVCVCGQQVELLLYNSCKLCNQGEMGWKMTERATVKGIVGCELELQESRIENSHPSCVKVAGIREGAMQQNRNVRLQGYPGSAAAAAAAAAAAGLLRRADRWQPAEYGWEELSDSRCSVILECGSICAYKYASTISLAFGMWSSYCSAGRKERVARSKHTPSPDVLKTQSSTCSLLSARGAGQAAKPRITSSQLLFLKAAS
jgi:hypothetical protein